MLFKTVRYFSQSILVYFHIKKAQQNLVIELCRAPSFLKNILQLFINFTHSFVAIELLTFCKNAKTILLLERALTILAK